MWYGILSKLNRKLLQICLKLVQVQHNRSLSVFVHLKSQVSVFEVIRCLTYVLQQYKFQVLKLLHFLCFADENECELNCLATGEAFYVRHAARVIDGTPCNRKSRGVCVSGVCQVGGESKMRC